MADVSNNRVMESNLKHLQILTTPSEYLAVWRELEKGRKKVMDMSEAYWQQIPRYLIARCPLCGGKYEESLDTYTLRRWVRAAMGDYVFWHGSAPSRCEHFVRAHHFINLNGLMPSISPSELDWSKMLSSEVPHVMANLLTDDVESYVVMHALPICRIEGNQFVPRYSLYMLTYYAPESNIEPLLDRLRHYEPDECKVELLARPPGGPEGETWWDLPRWVKAKKLLWLDPDDTDLPLRAGPIEAFPYSNIDGRKEPYFDNVPPIKLRPAPKRAQKKQK